MSLTLREASPQEARRCRQRPLPSRGRYRGALGEQRRSGFTARGSPWQVSAWSVRVTGHLGACTSVSETAFTRPGARRWLRV